MSPKIGKRISSLSFSFQKLYRRLSTAKPSTLVLSIIAIFIAVFLFGGGLYDLIMKPYPSVYYGGRFVLVYPQLSEQFVADSVISMILYSLGIIGLITIYQSTKYAYRPRQAYMLALFGFALLFIAYIYLEITIQLKLSGG
jgi:hypothetical protein